MRVGIFHDGLEIPPKAGVPYRFYYLSKELQKQGVEIVLFLADRFSIDRKKLEETGFECHVFSPPEFYNNYDSLKKAVAKSKVDILQVDCSQAALWYGVKLSQELKLPLITEMHDVDHVKIKSFGETNELKLSELKFTQYAAGYLSDAVVCFTQTDFDQLAELGIESNKINRIGNGIDQEYFSYSEPNLDNNTIIFLGNMYYLPNKLAAERIITDILPHVDMNVILVGMVEDHFLQKYSSSRVKFTGGVSDIRPWLQMASLAVAPVFEGSGMRIKYLNFAAAGVPILTTSSAISGYNDNIAFVEDNLKKYPETIKNLLSNKNMLRKQSKIARKIIENSYSWEKIAQKAIKLYSQIKYSEKKGADNNIIDSQFAIKPYKPKPLWLEDEERTQSQQFSIPKYQEINTLK